MSTDVLMVRIYLSEADQRTAHEVYAGDLLERCTTSTP